MTLKVANFYSVGTQHSLKKHASLKDHLIIQTPKITTHLRRSWPDTQAKKVNTIVFLKFALLGYCEIV